LISVLFRRYVWVKGKVLEGLDGSIRFDVGGMVKKLCIALVFLDW